MLHSRACCVWAIWQALITCSVLLASAPLFADSYVDSKSPDRKFALQVTRGDKQPFPQSDALIEQGSGKVVVDLDKDQPFDPEAKLVWTTDSQRFAYVRRTDDNTESLGTRVFQRNGATFDEIKLPDLPAPKMPAQTSASEKKSVRIKPIHWSDPVSLELEYEIITWSGWRGAEKIALQFDRQGPPSIVKAEPEPLSILDYYLLLPDGTLETPARSWLHNATVDKENGYLSVSGDGAQPSFEVALFRYRDGRPLLALCSAELESEDYDCITLDLFELGTDGRMQKAPRKIFPIPDQWSSGEYNKKIEDFRFYLPRQGRTVLVRSAKTKKILHKVTWNGEKFVQEK
jgi:hypothetical protein